MRPAIKSLNWFHSPITSLFLPFASCVSLFLAVHSRAWVPPTLVSAGARIIITMAGRVRRSVAVGAALVRSLVRSFVRSFSSGERRSAKFSVRLIITRINYAPVNERQIAHCAHENNAPDTRGGCLFVRSDSRTSPFPIGHFSRVSHSLDNGE